MALAPFIGFRFPPGTSNSGRAVSIADRLWRVRVRLSRNVSAPPRSSPVQAASAALVFSTTRVLKRDGGMPFCVRNWRLKFERLLNPTA